MTENQVAMPGGWRAATFGEIDSTNSEAMRRARAGERGPLWITAAVQTRGKGRSGRPWISGSGNLAATLLFAPACSLGSLPELSLLAGVATFDALCEARGPGATGALRLKWPNDVLVDGNKVSGILVESSLVGGFPVVAIGIGVNVEEPPALKDRQAASVSGGPHRVHRDAIASRLAFSLARWLGVWDNGSNFAQVREAWLARAGARGEPMSVHAGDELVAGLFAGLAEDGGLLLETAAGGWRKFAFGDVALGSPRV
jgi:BirA family transcriptional regulator, biotin operon repressor / biotin---[acetyl-CoA-carboxylase] ligase